ncbi:MAG TPA: VanZ family protein [Candidatus Solibacter sp.]
MPRLLIIVVAFIVYGSLYPFHFDFDRIETNPLLHLLHAWPARIDKFAWRDAGVNLLLYFPLGVTAFLTMARRLPRAVAAFTTMLLGLILSASIEMLQIFDASRTSSLIDVACNFAGTVAGVAAALIFQPQITRLTGSRRSRRGAAGALLLACTWAGYQLFPFVPLLSRGRLRDNLARFLSTPFSAVEVSAAAAEWFAFALLMRSLAGRFRAPWLALTMLALPLRLLIVERRLAPSELLGAAVALLLWTFPEEEPKLIAGAVLLAIAIVLRELEPFRFVREAQPFSWIPFAATLAADRQSATLVLLRKAFEYGAIVWMLRAAGYRYRNAGIAAAAALLLLELLQRHLPHRQPEITDAFLAALMAVVLWGVHAARDRSVRE